MAATLRALGFLFDEAGRSPHESISGMLVRRQAAPLGRPGKISGMSRPIRTQTRLERRLLDEAHAGG
ncbi:MAG TPA: hypothetical protein VKK19_15740 [Candidatus Dormibacteraeota bacterium]|nr:hypothetical protein [Candidatus Dormibacteraeota bacterium]